MVYKFKDKNSTIKHLSFIIETKIVNSQTLAIKESYGSGNIIQDLLFYDKAKTLEKDIKKFFKELKVYTEFMNNVSGATGFLENGSERRDEEEPND